jgi:hypothetical protein
MLECRNRANLLLHESTAVRYDSPSHNTVQSVLSLNLKLVSDDFGAIILRALPLELNAASNLN